MKLAIRIFALSVVVAGVAAASMSSSTTSHTVANHLSATSSLPVPSCGPGMCGTSTSLK